MSKGLACAVAVVVWVAACSEAAAQKPRIGRIAGNIDGIANDGEQYFISGWACQRAQTESIEIHIYSSPSTPAPARSTPNPASSTPSPAPSNSGPAPSTPSPAPPTPGPAKRVLVTASQANFDSEPAVNSACQDAGGGKHRFFVALPFGYSAQSRLFVHGIRIVEGVPNDAIAGSGLPLRHLDRLGIPFPTPAVPPVSGAYRALASHPRVFTSEAELKDLAIRINRPASYSAQRFAQLAQQIAQDLAASADWDATYSGCFVGPYLYAFSYEPQDGHDAETHAALKPRSNAKAPAGGAVVAARLALYAALVKAGAAAPQGSPDAGRAAALAKRILLAWADRGFPRDAQGRFLSLPGLSCDKTGKITQYTGKALPLQLGRGAVYSVHAQDLLQSIGALNAPEEVRLNQLHTALFDLIRQGYNQGVGSPQPACQRYANGGANGLAALLAIARLLDDPQRFNAVLHGTDRAIPVVLPWTRFFDGAIYGQSDHPMDCYRNNGPDGLHSGLGFTTPIVAAGEVQDRYRAGLLQTFGYPMFTLERLINAAEILRIAGFDAYGYRGTHGQSIELALQYYACYGKTPGFYKTVSRENARACPNYEQYYGKVVNGVDPNIMIGAYRFPDNPAITAVEGAAKDTASSGAFALDAILFGRWRG